MKITLPVAALIAVGILSFHADRGFAQSSPSDGQTRTVVQAEADKPAAAAAAAPAAPPAPVAPAASSDVAPKAAPAAASEPKKPLDIVKSTELHTLKNPYTDNAEAIAAGKKLYFSYSCNGCHGGNGGGGMCPPISNDTWVYGSDDDILFRLVALGSQELQKNYSIKRKGQETVVGPMPPFGELIKSDQELWKIIAFLRTNFRGDISKRNW